MSYNKDMESKEQNAKTGEKGKSSTNEVKKPTEKTSYILQKIMLRSLK